MNYRTMYRQAIKGDRSFGKWLHLGLSSPADTDIVTPNNDTPYSWAWLDLRAEPWVLTTPKIEPTRFYTSQWNDYWGYVLDNPGSVIDGNNGHSYLIASPQLEGHDAARHHSCCTGRERPARNAHSTQVMGGEKDLSRVKEIQQSYQLQPLSKFLGTPAPGAAPAIQWPAWSEGDENREAYWGYVSFLLPFIKPNSDDSPMYAKLASIGLKAGSSWHPEKLDPAVRAALQQGIEEARAKLPERCLLLVSCKIEMRALPVVHHDSHDLPGSIVEHEGPCQLKTAKHNKKGMEGHQIGVRAIFGE